MCHAIFTDDVIILRQSEADVRKVDCCSIEHLHILVVQLLHTHTHTDACTDH